MLITYSLTKCWRCNAVYDSGTLLCMRCGDRLSFVFDVQLFMSCLGAYETAQIVWWMNIDGSDLKLRCLNTVEWATERDIVSAHCDCIVITNLWFASQQAGTIEIFRVQEFVDYNFVIPHLIDGTKEGERKPSQTPDRRAVLQLLQGSDSKKTGWVMFLATLPSAWVNMISFFT